MKVRVYRNLAKKCWSVQEHIPGKGWRLWRHMQEVFLENVRFVVSEAGRDRVVREQRKNVHAYAEGELRDPISSSQTPLHVKYNPYKSANFYTEFGKIESSPLVTFQDNGQVFSEIV